MVNRKYLFIEGTTDTTNGNLREGFAKLLEQKLKGSMPSISMGEGKTQTIRKFNHSANSKLLCDLDGPATNVETDLRQHGIFEKKESVFYMIQEMEAWFISQPNILDDFYKTEVSERLVKKHGSDFSKPDEELQRITKDTKKGSYHKVAHGVQLLKMLDAVQLSNDFPDFKNLIDTLAAGS